MPDMISTPTLREAGEPASCRHHWVIATPDGPLSEGRCKRCGQRRSFFNVYEDVLQASSRTRPDGGLVGWPAQPEALEGRLVGQTAARD